MPKVVVVYESMYGNTHLIADAIGKGFGQATTAEIVVVPVAEAEQHLDQRRSDRRRRAHPRPRHEP